MKQTTLRNSFTLSGKGLHTGLQIEATFCPAPENHGYKIQRTDLEDEPVIDAVAENVVASNRGTVVAKGDVVCSTIEHAMAALYALGVDNCLIKTNGPELPILDGSAKPYVDEILKVGLVEQNADKEYEHTSEASRRAAEISGKIKAEDINISKLCKELLGDDDIEEASVKLEDFIDTLSEEFKKLNSEIKSENERLQRKESLEKLIPEKEKELEEIKTSLIETEKKAEKTY